MPNKNSAKKELRKNKKNQAYNKNIKHNVKSLIKKSSKTITDQGASAKEILTTTIKALDKAVQKGVIKKNTASRKKAQLQLHFNKTAVKK